MTAFQNFVNDGTKMPRELNMRLFITNRFVNFEGLFYGDKAGLQSVLGPLLKSTNASLVLSQQGGWVDQLKHFGNGVNLDQGHPYNMVSLLSSSSSFPASSPLLFHPSPFVPPLIHPKAFNPSANGNKARNLLLILPLHQRPHPLSTLRLHFLLVHPRQGQQARLVRANRRARRSHLSRCHTRRGLHRLRPPQPPFHVPLLRPRRQGRLPHRGLLRDPKLCG